MAIAVIGMHRSGTSMVTRMLVACGMHVGPLHELLGATPDNPTGHWERRAMVLLDDAVLDRLGMAWDHVPQLPEPGWHEDAAFDDLLEQARMILASFPHDAPWGWKDPRTSITLPFWERALGERADVVLCVRNPLDVAASLAARGGMSPRLGFALWRAYSEAALELAHERRSVVTHYDAYFHDAPAELARVAGAVGLQPTAAQLSDGAATAERGHRHSMRGLADLVRSSVPDESVALYLELLAAAGPVMAAVAAGDEMVVEQDGSPVDRAETTEWVARFRREQGLAAAGAASRSDR